MAQTKTRDQLAREKYNKSFAELVEAEYKKQAQKVLSEDDYYISLYDRNNNGILDGSAALVGTEAYQHKIALNTRAKRAQMHTQWEQYVTTTNASNNSIRRAIEATIEQELYLAGNENAVDRYTKQTTPNTLQYQYTQQGFNMQKYLIPFVAVVAVVFIISVLRK